MLCFHVSPLLVKGKYPLDQGNHFIVAGFIGGVGEVDGVDRDYFHPSYQNLIGSRYISRFPPMNFITFAGARPACNSSTMNFIGSATWAKNILYPSQR